MIGQTIAHYRITAALGAGGMGEVYRATDTKLGREVALKVLPAEFVDDPHRLDRFEREARAVASLNHPHIVTIHSVEEAEGIRFLTMELIEGRSLDKLISEGGMDLGLFFDLVVPLAEAISAAHDKSVIHRDLKPPNVMVDGDGRLKVLDFGLAKLHEVGDASDSTELPTEALTGIGMVVGTMPYMSPEQIEGEIVDHRTDIFSLGVLLYEMAIGERPFLGKSSPALMSSILKDVPKPVVELRSDMPRHLGRIIGRCLEKKRRDRYQTARDVFNELKALQRESSSMGPPGARPAAPPTRTPPRPSSHPAHSSSAVISKEGFWVAVLPFKYTGGDEDLVALAEGLSEDIVTGLSRFSYLRVIARGSTLKYAGEGLDVRAVGEELGARYVMEGSLRRAGNKLRLAVQLVDTDSGAHLWAEAYDRDFDAEDLFALQDELVPTIVSTVADTHGVLPRSMGEALRSCSPGDLTPYEAVLRSFSYFERVTAEELAAAREGLELAVQKAPDSADAWAMMALLCAQEYGQGFKLLDDPLEIGATAARRAVEAGPSNHLAHFSLAQVLFFHKDFGTFRNTAARAAELNPMDGNSIAFLGELLTYAGDSERGLELAGRAKRLNPNHPGWYWYADFFHAYRERDYAGALAVAQKVNLPDHWGQHVATAAACGQLGDCKAAGNALKRLLEIRPDFARIARHEFEKWWDPEWIEHIVDGLRKAGLEIPQASEPAPSAAATGASHAPDSGAARTDEGFWVAVLPFKSAGDDSDLTALAEGLTEEIVTGLSRFSFLRVIARSSTSRLARDTDDVRVVGKELGARYVMEGSVRQAGSMLRIAAQLVDATTGAHLWAETYNRSFHPGAIFELQDDLVPRIVSTVADWSGVLPRALSEAVRSKTADELSPYEAVLRGCGYYQRVRPDEHAAVRAGLERAVAEAPRYADAWVMLSMMCGEEHRFGFNVKPDPLGRALDAARQAVDADPSNHLAHLALAQAMFFRKEFVAFRSAAERALAVNPMDGFTVEYLGHLLAFAGDWERGCELGERGRQLNPHHPAWYWALPFLDAYRKGDYEGARALVPKALMPGQYYSLALFTALYGQLGEREAAGEALREVLALKPDFAEIARDQFGKWYLPQLVELLIDGLRKAGLAIPADSDSGSSSTATHAPSSASGEAHADEGFWVAVLPFKSSGGDADLEALADSLTVDVVTGLSRFSYLRVVARSSTLRYADEGADVRVVGEELCARYVMEGSLRRAGKKLRVAVQLADTVSGAHLWAEAYDRDFSEDELFALQDDLVPRIVSTCADHFGVLARAISEAVRGTPLDEMNPYEALMRGFGYHFRLTPEEHAEARDALEQAVRQAPSNADCWAMLAWVYAHEFAHDFNPRPKSLDRALDAARRAVDLAPSNHLAQQVLAVALFFRKETAACLSAAERALELNPLDGSNEAIFITCFAGDWDRGCKLVRRAMELNPHHPRWYGLMFAFDEYRKENYRAAVDEAVNANASDLFWTSWLLAAAYGQLGDLGAARKALDDLLSQKEDFARTGRDLMERWFEPELVEHFMDGLHKAGLVIGEPAAVDVATSGRATVPSGGVALSPPSLPPIALRPSTNQVIAPTQQVSAETKSIVVLPFANLSPDPDAEYFSDGLTDEIITDLSQVRALRVISRSSAMRLKGDGRGLASIGRDLACRYVLEGSVRRAANSLRITARLVDAADDVQLWADKYGGTLDDVFDIQERVSRSIVDALEIRLTPQEAAQLAERPIEDVRAQESYLRARSEIWSFMPGSLDMAISHLEAALGLVGDNALIYQGLGEAYFQYVNIGAAIGREEEFIHKAERCADEIFALEPESPRGYLVRSQTQLARGDIHSCARSLRRVLKVYPNEIVALQLYTHALGWLGGKPDVAAPFAARLIDVDPLNAMSLLMTAMVPLFAGRFPEAVDAARRMFDLDPVTPVWRANYVMALSYARQFDEAEALTEAVTAEPDSDVGTWWMGICRAAWRGDRAEVLRLADGPYQQVAEWDAEVPWVLACAHAAVGANDEALHWLDRAIDGGMINYPFFSEHDWYLDGIRGDERFARAMERARREWERFDV